MDNSGPKKSNLNRLPTILASQNESNLSSKLSQMEEELDALRIKNILLQDELLKATNNNPVSNEPVYFEDLSLKTEEELRSDLRKLETQYKDLAVSTLNLIPESKRQTPLPHRISQKWTKSEIEWEQAIQKSQINDSKQEWRYQRIEIQTFKIWKISRWLRIMEICIILVLSEVSSFNYKYILFSLLFPAPNHSVYLLRNENPDFSFTNPFNLIDTWW